MGHSHLHRSLPSVWTHWNGCREEEAQEKAKTNISCSMYRYMCLSCTLLGRATQRPLLQFQVQAATAPASLMRAVGGFSQPSQFTNIKERDPEGPSIRALMPVPASSVFHTAPYLACNSERHLSHKAVEYL
jgi:hypothetical protein